MKSIPLLLLCALISTGVGAAQEPAAPIAPDAIMARLHSNVARTAYEEYVAETVDTAERQAAAFAALEKNVATLSGDQAREQLALIETLMLTRAQLSQSRRAVLACAQLSREESDLILGELARLKARWDKLLADEVPARKAALVRQIEIAAVAVMPAAPAPAAMRKPADVLAAASRRLRPTGTALIGGEYHIMLDGQRMKAGQTVKVNLDREYVVTLAAVSRNSYTLALDGETLVVPME